VKATLAVIAKAPRPGLSKTRLSPPLSPEQAARLAEAALWDTLSAVSATAVARRVLVLEGEPGPWPIDHFELLRQRGDGLDERLANAFTDIGGATLIVGMDTPQVQPRALERALECLRSAPAVLAPALDGGYWAIGLSKPDRDALLGVPMSTAGTLRAQRRRLRARGLQVAELETLRDVDTYADALAVARTAPWTRFAATFAAMTPDKTAA
jgi:rSAM/selenodomain-associated transferase 1